MSAYRTTAALSSSHFLLAALVCVAADLTTDGSAVDSGVCKKCLRSSQCPKDMFCCPFQKHCIPQEAQSCLCPNKGSSKSLLHNNERVWQGKEDCDGIKCEFCPGTNGPKNTCLMGNRDLCVAKGAQKQNAMCVFGDHCACSGGFVCSDTKEGGECRHGTGGIVFCEKKALDMNSTITTEIVDTTTTAKITTKVTTKTTTTTSSITTTTRPPEIKGTCEQCKSNSECESDFFCCPHQRHCIPKSKPSCLCPDVTSEKSDLHNNARVFKREKNCDGVLCEFCPGVDHPENSCTANGCRSAGANIEQGYCEHGDHCRCVNGFVCSDTLREGACGDKTGGFVFCVKKPQITQGSNKNTTSRNGRAATDPDTSSTCTKHYLIIVLIFIIGVTTIY